jgi:hypothetical protein
MLFHILQELFSYSSLPVFFLSLIPNYNQKEYTRKEQETIEKMTSASKFLEILISYLLIPLASVFTLILLIYIIINFNDEFGKTVY